MSRRQTYDLVIAPTGEIYRSLLRALAPLATKFGLVADSKTKIEYMKASAKQVFEALEPNLLSIDEIREWPGSELADWVKEPGTRYLYRLTPEVLDVLLQSAQGLYEWAFPNLPSDPHLLRDDDSTVLASITTEDDAWLELDDDEYAYLIGEIPQLGEGGLRLHEDS